eukprot:919118-Karenia_brevis.AAC.1
MPSVPATPAADLQLHPEGLGLTAPVASHSHQLQPPAEINTPDAKRHRADQLTGLLPRPHHYGPVYQ